MNQTMGKSIDDIIQSLKENPMFHLSLGSKELFHSNFLEFLWEQNKVTSLKMLKEMAPNEEERINRLIEIKDDLFMAREKEHFDICIFHNEGNKIVCDIIIENKVKSIPYKAQLSEYIDKIRKKKQKDTPVYILLSLTKKFPQVIDIGKKWVIVNYDELKDKIRQHAKEFTKENNGVANYIEDYCCFVTYLGQLNLEKILKGGKKSLQSETYKLLKEIRLHDIYLKLKGSYSIGNIYNKIKKTINTNLITFGKEDRDNTEHLIFLSSSYNNGKCTITAAIRKNDIFYIVQIEGNPFDGKDGNQYRHMINKINLAKDNSKKENNKKRTEINFSKLEKELADVQQGLNFIKFITPFEMEYLPDNPTEDYCKYEPHVVYKYKKFNDRDFDKMLDFMVKDVINTYKTLLKAPQINKQ